MNCPQCNSSNTARIIERGIPFWTCLSCGWPGKKAEPVVHAWPRLSQTLTFHRHIGLCQSCGVSGAEHDVVGWQEHDDSDRAEPIVVMLCRRCSDALIEPHPRLYRRLQAFEPFPGAMECCIGCVHLDSLACRHPSLKANGGPGLNLTFPKPTTGFWDGRDRKTGKRTGGRFAHYCGPVVCEGRKAT